MGYMDINVIKGQANALIHKINQMELEQMSSIKTKEYLENQINELVEKNKANKEALDIATHAIEILRQVSDEAVKQAYEFLELNLNAALEKMFSNTTRKIRLKEYVRNHQYPQLEIELTVGNGKVRSLKTDSGHGLAQIVSLLCILSLIVITDSRRILVMDEVISGLSVHNRKIVTDILWSFTEIGFQFIVNDHGYIPEGSHVYHLEMVGDVSHVKQHYIAETGVYLQGNGDKEYNYSNSEHLKIEENEYMEEIEDNEDIEIEPNKDINSQPEVNISGNVISI